jgi:hypothetical protein
MSGTRALAAQTSLCLPSADSHEAQTLAILSVPIAFTGAQAPSSAHGWSLGVEGATLPTVDPEIATPTTCRPGKSAENTRPIPGIARLRLEYANAGWQLELGWIPPVPVNEVKANLAAVAVARAFSLGSSWSLGLRAHAVFGALHAPVTCDDAELRDAASECYQGTRSNDRWQPGVYGVEAVVGSGATVRPYLGIGYNWLRPRFRVDFTNAAGSTDNTEIDANLQRVALFGGVSWQLRRWSLSGEGYATPKDAISVRLVARASLGR